MTTIRCIETADSALIPGLSRLFKDAVEGGASLGFLAPMALETADAYWKNVLLAIRPVHALWVAEDGGEVVGSVQLVIGENENGRHRAEVKKLFVLVSRRGEGIAAQLMDTLEAYARERKLRLLFLDTLVDSYAERFYTQHGWTRAGEIPDYAGDTQGKLCATALYWKLL